MMLFAATTGIVAAVLMLTAGYILGVRRGARARERLWEQGLDLAEDFRRERQDAAERYEEMRAAVLGQDPEKSIDLLLKQGDAMQRMLEPLARRAEEDDNLRTTVEHVLTPLIQKETLGLQLSHIKTGTGRQGDLTRLLDEIAEKGGFRVVLLSDDKGLPLASTSNAHDLERLGGMVSLLLVMAERIGREEAPSLLSIMLHDSENSVTLCRIFPVRGQRLMLTAVTSGAVLTSNALDSALAKVDTILSS